MSHHCHDHDHDHSHDAEGILGPSDSIQAIVDIDNAVALNSNGDVKVLFRSWDRRMNEQQIQSDDDPELSVTILSYVILQLLISFFQYHTGALHRSG
jgi:hypothetical protein